MYKVHEKSSNLYGVNDGWSSLRGYMRATTKMPEVAGALESE